MAALINNRIYLECEIGSIDSYMKEMMEVIESYPDKHVIIWDQSKQEEKLTNDEFFNLSINMNKIDDKGVKVFDRAIWASLVADSLYRTKFLQFGLWKPEISLINEIKSVCKILRIEEYGEQREFFVESDASVFEYITTRYLDTDGHIKWFNLSLYSSDDESSLFFASGHFGEEIYILKLSDKEVEKAIAAVANNYVHITINRHQKSIKYT